MNYYAYRNSYVGHVYFIIDGVVMAIDPYSYSSWGRVRRRAYHQKIENYYQINLYKWLKARSILRMPGVRAGEY